MSEDAAAVPSGCPAPSPGYEDGARLAGLAIFTFACAYIPLTILWWWLRRTHTLLRKRSTSLMSLTAVGIMLNITATSWVTYNGRNTFPCDAHVWITMLVIPVGAGPVVSRLVLFYNNQLYSNLLLHKRTGSNMVSASQWERRRFRFLRSLFALLCSKGNSAGDGDLVAKKIALEAGEREPESSAAPTSGSITSLRVANRGSTASNWTNLLFVMSHSRAFSLALITPWVLIAGVSVAAQYLRPGSAYGRGCYGCALDTVDIMTIGVMLCLSCIVAIFVLTRTRKTADPFGIMSELRLILVLGLLLVIFNVMEQVDPGGLSKRRVMHWGFLTNLVALAVHTVQCTIPVLKTYGWLTRAGGGADVSSQQRDWTISEVLSNTYARGVFAEYLATEFSIENLWFYDAAVLYEQHAPELSDSKLLALAKEINGSFIAEGSLMEINISGSLRRTIRDAVLSSTVNKSRPAADLFLSAKKIVRLLMEEDAFPRFRKSNLYPKLYEEGAGGSGGSDV